MSGPSPEIVAQVEDLSDAERRTFELVLELVHEEEAGQRITLAIGPYSCYTLVGLLQLVLRNPGVAESPGLNNVTRRMADLFAEIFRDGPLWDVLQAGFDPNRDVDQNGQPATGQTGEPACFTCPECDRTSYNPNDALHRYCGACHQFYPQDQESK